MEPETNIQSEQAAVLSIKDWIITFIIAAIPIVNIIMLFVWGFGDSTNPNKANWAKASLILMAAVAVLYLLIMLIFAGAMFSGMN